MPNIDFENDSDLKLNNKARNIQGKVIIDDEADFATRNALINKNAVTPINALLSIFGGPSAEEKLALYGGTGPGFNFWRFSLSTLVLFLHTFFVCYGVKAEISHAVGSIGRPIFMALLPVFFGLSGFLVAGSAIRTRNVATFLSFRALRLIPALAVETTLAALVLGPLMTAVPLSEYFTDKQFFAYFGNIIGRVRFELPGVFADSPVPSIVNMNLWTLHAELECYALMAIAIICGVLKRRVLALSLWAVVTIALTAWNARTGDFEPQSLYPTSIFVYSFCTCVVAFLWCDKIPVNRALFLAVVATYGVLVYLPQTVFLVIPLLAYLMIYVGLSPLLNFRFLQRGDYSYGIYLYGFVIQQTLVSAFPAIGHWWIIFPLALFGTVCVSALSWHTIEKPALRLKQVIGPFLYLLTWPSFGIKPTAPKGSVG
jgi:peptidoglycan/LPS O-acetylase OafA/YrhL